MARPVAVAEMSLDAETSEPLRKVPSFGVWAKHMVEFNVQLWLAIYIFIDQIHPQVIYLRFVLSANVVICWRIIISEHTSSVTGVRVRSTSAPFDENINEKKKCRRRRQY